MAHDDFISSPSVGSPTGAASPPASSPGTDPVRARRAMVARWNRAVSRVGYLLYLIAVVMFFVALLTDFTSGQVAVITTSMIVGSLLLAPSIVIGYAVKAAEKDDIARGL